MDETPGQGQKVGTAVFEYTLVLLSIALPQM